MGMMRNALCVVRTLNFRRLTKMGEKTTTETTTEETNSDGVSAIRVYC